MKLQLAAGALLILLVSCVQKSTKNTLPAQKDISGLFSKYWEKHAQLYPIDATQQGDNRYNDVLPDDQTQAYRDTLKAFYTTTLNELKTYKRDSLNANDQISYDVLAYEMNIQLEGLKQNTWMLPFNQFWGLPITLAQLGSGDGFQPFKTVKDYQNWLLRVKAFGPWTDSAIANMKTGISKGLVFPASLVLKMIPQMQAMVVDDPSKSVFYGPLNKFPASFTAQQKEELKTQYIQMIQTDVIPDYKKLLVFLQKDYLPKARKSSGLSAIPGGKNMYSYLVKYYTTTNEAPEEIYKTGLSEVTRIRSEMELVKNEVGFSGDLPEFFTYLRTSPRFTPFKSAKDVLNAFSGIYERVKPNVNELFGTKPKALFEIRQTEAFREASASAEYNQGSPDGKRPGIFYVPVPDAAKFNITSGMESLFLHEAIPGHHYQVSLQQENESLPAFRRFAWYGAYGEGWALYTESLGKELGLYTDPYQYMGALGDEMHRAVRLVVDVAIHLKGMSREQAIKYMMENESIDENGATAEVERYMAIPGQALSYKVGALKIRELRGKYQKELKGKFRLSDFHDELLKDGCLPLSILESKMNKWAAGLK
ncbi:protein of unknown function DUF885 [Arcticibacter svalbardensis MN12-7]|uniref:DUF885 domain-containing protein n=1 Tax=Arcticibacter svalbardensis MN12-7 TaxID=1150600 RepID=R9GRE8_9SPHI|nr:DUF885 domain-containing protein [Arcticibacter svalbardensis]EOR94422.1 protein of unknown function DUF885 [Arcticibacter svalbardensis MN12-7]